jgi:ADP-ribose pyrophosphatase
MPKVKFKGKIISVVRQKKRLPNGYLAHFEMIVHPGAVLIAPFIDKNTIVFIRQYRPVIKTYLYELPAGTLKPKESLVSCAKRELIEETGYAAHRLTKLLSIFPVPGYSTELITLFKADNVYPHQGHQEPDDVIKVFPMTKQKVLSLFRQKKIRDAKTICALACCGWL